MSDRTLETFLSSSPPHVQSLALRARDLILRVCPDATEKVWPGWKVIGYGIGPSMAEMACLVTPAKTRITLGLAHGTELPDPAGLLEGAGKRDRHVKLRSIKELESPAVRALVRAAFAATRAAQQKPGSRAGRRDGSSGAPARRSGGSAADDGTTTRGRVSDQAVRARTAKGWDEWFAILDAAGAAGMTHKQIVAHLSAKHDVGPWWRQMVTVAYEQARGLREKHQTPTGYQVGVSKTIAVPLRMLYAAWTDQAIRDRWLPKAAFTIRKATPSKSLRIIWMDGSNVDVLFYGKGEGKSQVSVDHRKLSGGAEVARMRSYWKAHLEGLKELLER